MHGLKGKRRVGREDMQAGRQAYSRERRGSLMDDRGQKTWRKDQEERIN